MHNAHTPLMPSDLPPLSDASAVEILEFLHELVYRFEACYFGQIRRFYVNVPGTHLLSRR